MTHGQAESWGIVTVLVASWGLCWVRWPSALFPLPSCLLPPSSLPLLAMIPPRRASPKIAHRRTPSVPFAHKPPLRVDLGNFLVYEGFRDFRGFDIAPPIFFFGPFIAGLHNNSPVQSPSPHLALLLLDRTCHWHSVACVHRGSRPHHCMYRESERKRESE